MEKKNKCKSPSITDPEMSEGIQQNQGTARMSARHDHKVKLIIVGDVACGKTSLIRRIALEDTSCSHRATVGIDFAYCEMMVEDQSILLECWDTGGQEAFRAMLPKFFRFADIVVIAYDITSFESFANVHGKGGWIDQIDQHLDKEQNRTVFLVGTKFDLEKRRCITRTYAENKALEYGMGYIEVSALTGHNVEELRSALVRDIFDKRLKHGKIKQNTTGSVTKCINLRHDPGHAPRSASRQASPFGKENKSPHSAQAKVNHTRQRRRRQQRHLWCSIL